MSDKSKGHGMAGHEARKLVRQIVARQFGSKPGRIVRQTGGLSNAVYSVEHERAEYIVRLNPHHSKLNHFLKEQWATSRAREAGVPAPEVLQVGNQPVPHMILHRAPGGPSSFHPARRRILEELGRYAAVINGIPTHGFGAVFDWSRNSLSAGAGWKGFLHDEFSLDRRLRVLARMRMLPQKKLARTRAILERACSKGRNPSLNHGDLRLKNVLVDAKGRISAILDWENSSSNLAPEWELSLALHDLSIDDKEAFLRGYGMAPRKLAAIASTLKALNAVNYVAEIESLAASGNRDQLASYRSRLRGDFDLYSY